jgi:glycosyltransferase involved in cell wall biosynthesis
MRIAFFIYGDIEMNSGGFLYDRKIVEYLRAQGHLVRVMSLPWLDYAESISLYKNASAKIIEGLGPEKFDLIVQDELAHPLLSMLNRRIRKLNIPIISIVHHLRCSEEQLLGGKLCAAVFEAVYLTGVDGVILNSRATLEAIRRFRVAAGKSFIISAPGCDRFRNSFDPELINQKCAGPGPLRIVFAGNLIPRKGLHTLIAALEKMPAGSWRLSVAGDAVFNPGYAAGIRAMVEHSGLGGNIDFLGRVSDGELARLLLDSHVLVVPSSYEGFGIIYAEAMGFGLPAIGCRSGAVPELIEHGRNGFLIMPGDHSGLARH